MAQVWVKKTILLDPTIADTRTLIKTQEGLTDNELETMFCEAWAFLRARKVPYNKAVRENELRELVDRIATKNGWRK